MQVLTIRACRKASQIPRSTSNGNANNRIASDKFFKTDCLSRTLLGHTLEWPCTKAFSIVQSEYCRIHTSMANQFFIKRCTLDMVVDGGKRCGHWQYSGSASTTQNDVQHTQSTFSRYPSGYFRSCTPAETTNVATVIQILLLDHGLSCTVHPAYTPNRHQSMVEEHAIHWRRKIG